MADLGAVKSALGAAGMSSAMPIPSLADSSTTAATQTQKGTLNPILGNDFITNFHGVQTTATGAKGSPLDTAGISGFDFNKAILPIALVIGGIVALKIWKKRNV